MKDFDYLTLVWAAIGPSYGIVIALFPPKDSAAQLAYLVGSLLLAALIFLLIRRQQSTAKRQRAMELAEFRQIVHDEFVEAARIKNPGAPVPTPESVEPNERLEELLRRERQMLGAYGLAPYGVGPYGGQDAATIAARNAAIRQQLIVQQGDQDVPPTGPQRT